MGSYAVGLRYFSMHAFPNGKTPARFANVHHAFLKILSQQHLAYGHWQTSQAHQRLLLRIDAVSLLLDQDIRILLAEVNGRDRRSDRLHQAAQLLHPWRLHPMEYASSESKTLCVRLGICPNLWQSIAGLPEFSPNPKRPQTLVMAEDIHWKSDD